jgi:hypothetical protein
MAKADTTSKTVPVAVYPDGTVRTIAQRHGMWLVPYPAGHPAGSSSHGVQYLADVKRYVEEAGGKIERRPNPNYRSPLLFDTLMRGFN